MKRHLKGAMIVLVALSVTAVILLWRATGRKTENGPDPSPPVVGFSQMEMTNPWRIAETRSMQQAANERGYELVVRDARSDVAQQIEDCLSLISLPVDYLILAPRLEEGYERVFEAAHSAKIPVILVDRETRGVPRLDYACCITADFEREGRICAQILAREFEGRPCDIIELTGTPGSSVAKARTRGFAQELNNHANMRVVLSASGDFVRTTAQETMENLLQNNQTAFQAIFAHDDDTGIGAIQALKKAGLVPGRDVKVVSIAGQKDALKAIIAGELLSSVECDPRLGKYAFDIIEAIRQGREYEPRIVYTGRIYDKNNAEAFYDQAF